MLVPRQADPHIDSSAANDSTSWPFAICGLDILGHFPKAVDGYLYIAIDKFSK
jgi:hypothetical protein